VPGKEVLEYSQSDEAPKADEQQSPIPSFHTRNIEGTEELTMAYKGNEETFFGLMYNF
jgi:hypothetical protein